MLTKSTKCHFCGKTLEAGVTVRWHKISARQVSKYQFIPSRIRACCQGAFDGECLSERNDAERAMQQAIIDNTALKLAEFVAAGDLAGAAAYLSQIAK